jgi:hypothetical protein
MISKAKRNSSHAAVVDFLSIFTSGSFAVSVNGVPTLAVDAESKSLNLEAKGVKKSGFKLLNIVKENGAGVIGILKTSESTAKKLSETGWKVTVYDGNKVVLTMGSGVSRLTGYIHVNPLKLRTILEIV